MTPLVSVLTVTYKSADYVAEAIESVLAQSLENFELIVSDDASPDATWDVVQKYSADPRVRLHRHERNIGEYPNRIWAADQARGKYLIFVDGDDILYPHGLELLATTLEAFPDAAFALSSRWDERYIYPAQLSPRELYRSVFLGRSILECVFPYLLFRTDAYRSVGGLDPAIRTGDSHLCLRMGARYPSVLTWAGVAWWRERPGQASLAVWQDPRLAVETLRYSLELLANKDCPLDDVEKAAAHDNLCGVFLRSCARLFFRGHMARAHELVRSAGLPFSAWRTLLKKSRRPFDPGPFPQRLRASTTPLPPDWRKLTAVRRDVIQGGGRGRE